MQFGVIYKITNTVNGKVYIGQTVSTISHRWNQHKCLSSDPSKTSIKL